MDNQQWILVDTETTGFSPPIYVVELGAQRMCGWFPQGPPFRALLNQNQNMPSEVSRVHGYTREILERDGCPASDVYTNFSVYAEGYPLVSYNLDYDLVKVLEPEWRRLGIKPIGTAGFCALRLAQRLLDPVPAGNCKLQTLRQYYRLPERGAHTALGDVETVVDLLSHVLKPIAEGQGLTTWKQICAYTEAEWYPARIAFGRFKKRHVADALHDNDLMGWLLGLTKSTNKRSASMGRWYLSRLNCGERLETGTAPKLATLNSDITNSNLVASETGVVVFKNFEVDMLLNLIAAARAQLAELEASYTKERHAVDVTQAMLFKFVRLHYQRRDKLKLIVDYRAMYIAKLLNIGEDSAKEVVQEYDKAAEHSDKDYSDAYADAETKKIISSEEVIELKTLWKKLVILYHPDRFAAKLKDQETYTKLTTAINKAREQGDIALLREIADDPQGFLLRSGWGRLDFCDALESTKLRRLLDTLQIEIVSILDNLNELHESPEFELCQLSAKQPTLLEEVAADQCKSIDAEISELESIAEKLRAEINELIGSGESPI